MYVYELMLLSTCELPCFSGYHWEEERYNYLLPSYSQMKQGVVFSCVMYVYELMLLSSCELPCFSGYHWEEERYNYLLPS